MPRTIAEELRLVRDLTRSGDARRIRLAAGLSQTEIARSIAADQSTIARWEAGGRKPQGAAAIDYGRMLERLRKRLTE